MSNAYTTDMSTIPIHYNKRYLERLVPSIAMKELCMSKPLPANSGTTMYFPQMSASSTTVSAYKSTAGTVVSTEAAHDFRVSAVIEKYRNAKGIWDLSKLTGLSTYIDEVVDEQADQASQIIDKRILEEAYGTSAMPWGGGFSCFAYDTTAGVNILATSQMSAIGTFFGMAGRTFKATTATIRAAAGELRGRNVKPFEDGYYRMAVHTDTEMALMADTTWAASPNYLDKDEISKGIFKAYGGVKFVRDNNVYTSACGTSAAAYTQATAYCSVLVGKGALAISELNGGVKTYLKEPGTQDTSNPVDEFVTFGWKVMFVPKRLNVQCGLIVLTQDL